MVTRSRPRQTQITYQARLSSSSHSCWAICCWWVCFCWCCLRSGLTRSLKLHSARNQNLRRVVYEPEPSGVLYLHGYGESCSLLPAIVRGVEEETSGRHHCAQPAFGLDGAGLDWRVGLGHV